MSLVRRTWPTRRSFLYILTYMLRGALCITSTIRRKLQHDNNNSYYNPPSVCMYVCMFVYLIAWHPTVRSSQFYLILLTTLLPCLRTLELPFVLIVHNFPYRCANNYIHLLTASFLRLSIVTSYKASRRYTLR